MSNIFRVPVDNQHFKDTIEAGKSFKEVVDFLSGEERAELQRISRDGFIRFWGSLPGEANKRNFQKMAAGDELLCYRSGDYIALCKVAFTTINKNLAKYAWGEAETGNTWELIYFFSAVSSFKIDSSIINKEFGFADGPVMGFSAIADEKAKTFLTKYSSVSSFLDQLGLQKDLGNKISEEIAKLKINSPFEAQFYLVDLGNQLGFDTYVPPTDAGRAAFGKKLDELVTIRKNDLIVNVIPAIFDPLSNIDVVWFKGNFKPQYFYEVIHSTGMNEAFARLKAVVDRYETAKTRVVGSKEKFTEFEKSRRLYFPDSGHIAYKQYDDLIDAHSEALHFKKVIDTFLQ